MLAVIKVDVPDFTTNRTVLVYGDGFTTITKFEDPNEEPPQEIEGQISIEDFINGR